MMSMTGNDDRRGRSRDDDDDDPLAHARSLLRPGSKVFLRHSHPPGFLHARARWQGEYHLAHVQEGPGPDGARGENRFKALWKRNGYAATVSHVLRSPSDVIEFGSDGSGAGSCGGVAVQVEDDANGNVHVARVVDACRDRPGEVRVRWDRGDEALVHVSQVSLGHRGRKRVRRAEAAPAAAVVAAADGKAGAASAARGARTEARAEGRRKRMRRGGSVARANVAAPREDAEVISIDSSSEEEDDELSRARERRKRPPADRHRVVGDDRETTGSEKDILDEVDDFLAAGRERRKSGEDRAPAPVAAARGRDAREDAREGKEDEGAEARDGRTNAVATAREGANLRRPAERGTAREGEVVPGEDAGIVDAGGEAAAAAVGGVREPAGVGSVVDDSERRVWGGRTARASGEGGGMDARRPPGKEAACAEEEEEETAATEEKRRAKGEGEKRRETHGADDDDGDGNYAPGSEPDDDVGSGSDEEPAVVDSEEEEEASFVSEESSGVDDDGDWEEEERGARHGAAESVPRYDGDGPAVGRTTRPRRSVRGDAVSRDGSGGDDGAVSADGSDGSSVARRRTGASRAPRGRAAAWREREGPVGGPSRRSEGGRGGCMTVTPRKDAAGPSPPSPDEDGSEAARAAADDASAPRDPPGILLHGFCRSVKELRDDPHRMIEEVRSMLAKARECEGDSEEFREMLVDANMLLQQTLYNLNERTKFVRAPENRGGSKSPPMGDGNKGHIVRLAKQFGLGTRGELDDLFSRLDVDEHGLYSIDVAIPKIMEMRKGKNAAGTTSEEDEEEREEGEDDGKYRCQPDAAGRGPERPLELLGGRVRTVFEDGVEYEGTISTVHYRVTYDDGDNETLVSGAEAFENLACNEKYHLDGLSVRGDEIRCSALEIFSGCSLLSTLCKRKGMNVMSIDTDMDSNATMKADFSSDYVQHLLSSQTFDYIHASPVCSTYSHMAGGKHRNPDNYNRTPESHKADAMLMVLYFLIAKALEKTGGAMTATIENPRGWMCRGNIMKELFEKELGFKKFTIFYCQFGRGDQKPTHIWTNDWKLGNILEAIGGKCNCPRPHEEGVRRSGHYKNFAALPLKLCQIISTYVHSKHTQLKFEKLAEHGRSVVPRDILNAG